MLSPGESRGVSRIKPLTVRNSVLNIHILHREIIRELHSHRILERIPG